MAKIVRITREQLRRMIMNETVLVLQEVGEHRQSWMREKKLPGIVTMSEFASTFPKAFRAIKRELESDGEGPLVDEPGGPAFAISRDGTKGYWNAGGDTFVVDQSTTNDGEFEYDEDICVFMENEQKRSSSKR